MKFKNSYKKAGFFHSHNPFNAMLKNRLANTLGLSSTQEKTFTSPVLDQGETEECAIYCNAGTAAAITGKVYNIPDILNAILSYMNIPASSYEGTDLQTAMYAGVNPGFTANDGSSFTYDAIIWITPENGLGFCETINQYIQQYQRPANLAGVWFNEWFGSVNGLITLGATNIEGGHDMMLCGIGTDGMMDNQGSWGIASGSISGHYRFSPQVFDSYFTGYKVGIGIHTTDRVTKLLGQLSAAWVKLSDLL